MIRKRINHISDKFLVFGLNSVRIISGFPILLRIMVIHSIEKKICPSCAAAVPAISSKCPECEHQLTPMKECPGCAVLMEKGLSVCAVCGYEFPNRNEYFPGGRLPFPAAKIIRIVLVFVMTGFFVFFMVRFYF